MGRKELHLMRGLKVGLVMALPWRWLLTATCWRRSDVVFGHGALLCFKPAVVGMLHRMIYSIVLCCFCLVKAGNCLSWSLTAPSQYSAVASNDNRRYQWVYTVWVKWRDTSNSNEWSCDKVRGLDDGADISDLRTTQRSSSSRGITNVSPSRCSHVRETEGCEITIEVEHDADRLFHVLITRKIIGSRSRSGKKRGYCSTRMLEPRGRGGGGDWHCVRFVFLIMTDFC